MKLVVRITPIHVVCQARTIDDPLDHVIYNDVRNTVKPLYSGHLWDHSIVSAIWRCPPYRGSVLNPKNLLQWALFQCYSKNIATMNPIDPREISTR